MKVVSAIVAFLVVIVWFAFGHPKTDIANAFWPNTPAPWENVTSFYYPDKNDHTYNVKAINSDTIEECRSLTQTIAAANNDPNMQTAGYACGIGCSNASGTYVCRATVK